MKKPFIFLIIAIVLLGGLFILLKPKDANETAKESSGQNIYVKTEPEGSFFELVVKNRDLVLGHDKLIVVEGDTVSIKITVDEPEEFHLHGYDKSIDLEKDVQGELKFIADKTGRFPFELEKSKIELGALEVLPK